MFGAINWRLRKMRNGFSHRNLMFMGCRIIEIRLCMVSPFAYNYHTFSSLWHFKILSIKNLFVNKIAIVFNVF